jgi:hypothetical protein
MQAKEKSEADPVELSSLSDWYKISVRSSPERDSQVEKLRYALSPPHEPLRDSFLELRAFRS